MNRVHGKPIDLSQLKERVLSDLNTQSAYWTSKAGELRKHCLSLNRCPICDSDVARDVAKIHGFVWRQCSDCSQAYNSMPPNDEALRQFYAASDAKVREYRKMNVAVPKVEFISRLQSPPGRWLDVGCGNGDVLAIANDLGYECVGIEPNRASAEIARRVFGLEVHEEPFADYAKSNAAAFDIVSLIGLLDIVRHPASYIRQASSVLRERGIVVASVPNFESLSTAAQTTFPDKVICRHMHPSVLNAYTVKSVTRMLEDASFDLESIWFFGMDVYETLNNLALNVNDFSDSPLHHFLLANMHALQESVDRSELCDKFHFVARKRG
jgi:SAM-dependent methyltransferase